VNGLRIGLVVCLFAAAVSASGVAQQANARPKVLNIVREIVKLGHDGAHQQWEAGWPKLYTKSSYPYYVLAITAASGTPEAWYLSGWESFAQIGQSYQWMQEHPAAAAENARLGQGDAAHLDGLRVMQAALREDLSNGPMGNLGKVRVMRVTTWRVRPGQDAAWAALVHQWAEAVRASGAGNTWGTYEIVNGGMGGTYLVFEGFETMAAVDDALASGGKVAGAIGESGMQAFLKSLGESVISTESQIFGVDPVMSWVPKATADADPAFWNPKPAAAPKKP